jgi:hypothetical protein
MKAKLHDSLSFMEVLRGGKMSRDAGKAAADPVRDRPGRREGEFHNLH